MKTLNNIKKIWGYELWGARYSEAFFRTQDIERKR